MLDAITTTATAMMLDKSRLEIVNQNISNMQTPGYKRAVTESHFDELLSPIMQNTQGSLVQSRIPHELAISGVGFFEVQTDKGIFYTRRGDFHINEQGELATALGARLLGKSGVIRVDDNPFVIDKRGNVFINNQKTDEISIVNFDNDESLNYLGEGLYEAINTPIPVDSSTQLLQGFIEQSNVKSIDEMIDLVKLSRHFEASQRVMQTSNDLLSKAIRELGETNV